MSFSKPMRIQVEEYINTLQISIVLLLEQLDPSAPPFNRDGWIAQKAAQTVPVYSPSHSQTTSPYHLPQQPS